MGNDKLYHDVGNVFTTASAIMIPIGQTQSVVKGLTQFAIGEAGAYTAGQVAYHGTKLLGGSEEDAQTANFIGNLVGGYVTSSAASKFSLNKVKHISGGSATKTIGEVKPGDVDAPTTKGPVETPTPSDVGVPKTKDTTSEEMVKYYRVQGGGSKELTHINDDGTLSWNNEWKSDHNLNVSTGKDHSAYFKGKREGAYIVEVEVPKYVDDIINENVISQQGYKSNPLNQNGMAPKLVDEGVFMRNGFEGHAFELPAPINQWFIEYGQNARIIK